MIKTNEQKIINFIQTAVISITSFIGWMWCVKQSIDIYTMSIDVLFVGTFQHMSVILLFFGYSFISLSYPATILIFIATITHEDN